MRGLAEDMEFRNVDIAGPCLEIYKPSKVPQLSLFGSLANEYMPKEPSWYSSIVADCHEVGDVSFQ